MPYSERPDVYELTVTGLSPDLLRRQAERLCRARFGDCPFRLDGDPCVACLRTLGGRPRLWSGHFVAQALAEPLTEPPAGV